MILSLNLVVFFRFISTAVLLFYSKQSNGFIIKLNSFWKIEREFETIKNVRFSTLSSSELQSSLKVLEEFNAAYLERMKRGRELGIPPHIIEYERAQLLQAEGLREENEKLRAATKQVASVATVTIMGLKAETGIQGLKFLKEWVSGLSLPRGVLRAVDESNSEVPISSWDHQPVYIKYNSSENGNAYMKPYEGGYSGCIFQPSLPDGEFRQFGDLPLRVFI